MEVRVLPLFLTCEAAAKEESTLCKSMPTTCMAMKRVTWNVKEDSLGQNWIRTKGKQTNIKHNAARRTLLDQTNPKGIYSEAENSSGSWRLWGRVYADCLRSEWGAADLQS